MSRIPGGLQPFLDVDPERDEPLYRQLYSSLREAIVTGRLERGRRLPSTRTLARDIGVSRTTTLTAYRRLQSEGYLSGEVGSGSYVSDRLPEDALVGGTGAVSPPRRPARTVTPPAPHPFTPGVPASREFPWKRWRRLVSDSHADVRRVLYAGTDDQGHYALRAELAQYLNATRGMRCEPEHIVVTAGTQQAFIAAARLCSPDRRPLCIEDPSWGGIRRAIEIAGVPTLSVPADQDGFDVARVDDVDASAAFVMPGHQFPLGTVMSERRREQVLGWATRGDRFVIEHEFDSDFLYEGTALRAIHGMDADGRVVFIGSLGMLVFPSLRIGYAVLPPALVAEFVRVRQALGGSPPAHTQVAAAEFMASRELERHLRRMRVLYRSRRDCLVRQLDALDGEFYVGPHDVGTFVSLTLPDWQAAAALRDGAAERGVELLAFGDPGEAAVPAGVALGYAGYDERAIGAAIRSLRGLPGFPEGRVPHNHHAA